MSPIVLTVDQRRSRTSPDAVPSALTLLEDVPTLREFERTAGDELQALLDSPEALVTALERLLRDGRWHIGVGLGEVETPLPRTTREGRGEAYLAAREAVTAARSAPHHVRVVGEGPWTRHLESALWLWAGVLERRTEKGWEVADLTADGLTHEAIATRLGISQSAVSQRATAADLVDAARARELALALTTLTLTTPESGAAASSAPGSTTLSSPTPEGGTR